MFLGKNVLRVFRKFTGEHSCRSLISIKLFCNTKHMVTFSKIIAFSEKNKFEFSGPTLRSKIPKDIKRLANLNGFEFAVKKYFFEKK